MLNEFVAKKLGEVLAFAVVGIETFEKGSKALVSVLGDDMVEDVLQKCEEHKAKILEIAENQVVSDVVLKKLDGTGVKLRGMRDLYVGDQWDNPTELLEWSGFFEGAALVHWSLVKGAGETTTHPEIIKLAKEATLLHQELFDKAVKLLHEVGKTKAK
jgi:hypothetical protein